MKRQVASRRRFLQRTGQSALWGIGIVAIALGIGMVGYIYFGQMGTAEAFANAAMILSGMGPLDKLSGTGGLLFEGFYALVSGLLFLAVAGLVLAPALHRLLHRFHLEDDNNT